MANIEFELGSSVSVVEGIPRGEGGLLSAFPRCLDAQAPTRDQLLTRPDMSPVWENEYGALIDVYERVLATGVPNYRGAKIPLKHGLNIPEWCRVAHLFQDESLPDVLAYGFLSDHFNAEVPTQGVTNHVSATRNPSHIKAFLQKEVGLGAMVGPFRAQQFANGIDLTR